MISIGECAFITIGMPGGRQVEVALVPCPPSACSLRLTSNSALYSGVSGASWVVPHFLYGSNEGWPPPVFWRTPIHCPLRFGYCASSNAKATGAVHPIAAASAIAPIVLRASIVVLPL